MCLQMDVSSKPRQCQRAQSILKGSHSLSNSTEYKSQGLLLSNMANQAGASRVVDLQTFIDLAEHDIENTTALLNDYAGPIGQQNIRTWESAVYHTWLTLKEVRREYFHCWRMCRPPFQVTLPKMASEMYDATRDVPALEEKWLQQATEAELRERPVLYIVARWTRRVM